MAPLSWWAEKARIRVSGLWSRNSRAVAAPPPGIRTSMIATSGCPRAANATAWSASAASVITGFMAAATKIAAFGALLRVLDVALLGSVSALGQLRLDHD